GLGLGLGSAEIDHDLDHPAILPVAMFPVPDDDAGDVLEVPEGLLDAAALHAEGLGQLPILELEPLLPAVGRAQEPLPQPAAGPALVEGAEDALEPGQGDRRHQGDGDGLDAHRHPPLPRWAARPVSAWSRPRSRLMGEPVMAASRPVGASWVRTKADRPSP